MVFSDIAQKAFSGFASSTPFITPDGLTLEMVLHNQTKPPFSLQDFSDYLQLTYCSENLLFYQAVMDYKSHCVAYFNLDSDCTKPEAVVLATGSVFKFSATEKHLLNEKEQMWFETCISKFENILQDFILSDAAQEINLQYEIRHQLLHTYQTQQSYHPALLYPACNAVIELLRISAFISFATDPSRICVKKKKSKKNLVVTQVDEQVPPIPAIDLITPSASTGFLKRITTSLKFSYNKIPELDSPPMSPPISRFAGWRNINIPDKSSFLFALPTPTSEEDPVLHKSIKRPSSIH